MGGVCTADEECAEGLICLKQDDSSQACAQKKGVGDRCGSSVECADGMECLGEKCAPINDGKSRFDPSALAKTIGDGARQVEKYAAEGDNAMNTGGNHVKGVVDAAEGAMKSAETVRNSLPSTGGSQ